MGRWSILAATLMWSTSGFFAKSSWLAGYSGPLLAFWRALFASLVLLPAVRQPRWTWRLLPMVALFAAMNYTYLSSMATTEAANAIWLQYTSPAWILLFGVLCFGERLGREDLLLVAFGLVGVAVILAGEMRVGLSWGVVLGLFSGLFYAGVVLSLRSLRDYDSAWLVALNHLVTAAVLSPYLLSQPELWPTGVRWPLLAAFGMLQMGIPYLLFARGLRTTSGHEAAGIGLLEPLLVPVWAYLTSGEVPKTTTIAGGGLILAGLLVRYAVPWFRRGR